MKILNKVHLRIVGDEEKGWFSELSATDRAMLFDEMEELFIQIKELTGAYPQKGVDIELGGDFYSIVRITMGMNSGVCEIVYEVAFLDPEEPVNITLEYSPGQGQLHYNYGKSQENTHGYHTLVKCYSENEARHYATIVRNAIDKNSKGLTLEKAIALVDAYPFCSPLL